MGGGGREMGWREWRSKEEGMQLEGGEGGGEPDV